MIDREHDLPISRQAQALGVAGAMRKDATLAVRNCGPSRRSSSLSAIGICPMPRRTSEAGTSTK